MILYNVTVNVELGVHAEWLAWMKAVHIPEVMATGIFKSHRLCKLLLPKPEEGVTYAIQYYCENQEVLNRYFEEFAPALQQRHAAAYGNRAYAFRTVLEVV